jgi:5-methylcytosine-specific restriction endonuclease McrA
MASPLTASSAVAGRQRGRQPRERHTRNGSDEPLHGRQSDGLVQCQQLMPWKPKTHRPHGAVTAQRCSEAARNAQPHRKLLRTQRYYRFRKWLLRERPVCQRCDEKPSWEVHHKRKLVLHPEDLVDPEQCEALCPSCHCAATARGE